MNCPRCGGNLIFLDDDGDDYCLLCGFVLQIRFHPEPLVFNQGVSESFGRSYDFARTHQHPGVKHGWKPKRRYKSKT